MALLYTFADSTSAAAAGSFLLLPHFDTERPDCWWKMVVGWGAVEECWPSLIVRVQGQMLSGL